MTIGVGVLFFALAIISHVCGYLLGIALQRWYWAIRDRREGIRIPSPADMVRAAADARATMTEAEAERELLDHERFMVSMVQRKATIARVRKRLIEEGKLPESGKHDGPFGPRIRAVPGVPLGDA